MASSSATQPAIASVSVPSSITALATLTIAAHQASLQQTQAQQQQTAPLHSLNQTSPVAAQFPTLRSQRTSFLKVPPQDVQDQKPWRWQGYPGLCKFMASSSDAFVLRRFNKLNTRVILSMQDEIYQLEKKLEKYDERCMFGKEETENSGTLRNDPQPKRKDILNELKPLLKEYNEFVLTYSELRSRSTAQDYQVANVENWFLNNRDAIEDDEQKFVSTGDDLISIVPQAKSWLRLGMERINPAVLSKMFPVKLREGHVQNEHSFYASSKKMNAAETCVIVVLGLAVLLGPLWWLDRWSDSSSDDRLWIISGFVAFFTASLASATVEKPFQVLIGAAGYAAVLMVFMQQQNSPQQ